MGAVTAKRQAERQGWWARLRVVPTSDFVTSVFREESMYRLNWERAYSTTHALWSCCQSAIVMVISTVTQRDALQSHLTASSRIAHMEPKRLSLKWVSLKAGPKEMDHKQWPPSTWASLARDLPMPMSPMPWAAHGSPAVISQREGRREPTNTTDTLSLWPKAKEKQTGYPGK